MTARLLVSARCAPSLAGRRYLVAKTRRRRRNVSLLARCNYCALARRSYQMASSMHMDEFTAYCQYMPLAICNFPERKKIGGTNPHIPFFLTSTISRVAGSSQQRIGWKQYHSLSRHVLGKWHSTAAVELIRHSKHVNNEFGLRCNF